MLTEYFFNDLGHAKHRRNFNTLKSTYDGAIRRETTLPFIERCP